MQLCLLEKPKKLFKTLIKNQESKILRVPADQTILINQVVKKSHLKN